MNSQYSLIMVFAIAATGVVADETKPQANEPLTFKDDETGVILYVESDRRHVAAIDKDGKVLWHRDPFVDAGLRPYRTARPIILDLGKPRDSTVKDMEAKGKTGPFVAIVYDSTQFGVLDEATGNFTIMGRD